MPPPRGLRRLPRLGLRGLLAVGRLLQPRLACAPPLLPARRPRPLAGRRVSGRSASRPRASRAPWLRRMRSRRA
eukprot:4137153-Alexandrium_andersonii.AAC.1